MDLRWQSLIALLHLHLVSTTIWIERGGRAAWICCNGFHLVVLVKLNTKLVTMEMFSFVIQFFFNLDIGNSQAGQLQKRRRGLLLDDSDNL